MSENHEAVQEEVLALMLQGQADAAVEKLIEHHGPEVLGFLRASIRDHDEAVDVFLQFSEDVYKGLGSFQGRSSLRTWTFSVARNAMLRHLRKPHLRKPHLPLSQATSWGLSPERVRTMTQPWRRTEVKDRFAALREKLEPEDQALLNLRVEKVMAWDEIAVILDGLDPEDREAIKRRSAALRKRFERLKKELHRLAVEEGLIKPE